MSPLIRHTNHQCLTPSRMISLYVTRSNYVVPPMPLMKSW
jgi:hypothetical protein